MSAQLVLDRIRIARPGGPAVQGAAVIAGDRIRWIGTGAPPRAEASATVQRIDFGGAVLFPGFVDAHCHPLALGAALTAADCRPASTGSIAEIQNAIRRWASANPDAAWVRAFGYDELLLRESRHPTRHDLDTAVADRPVVLTHGSGHALVLNSAGLRAAGINESTDEPPGGHIDREPSTGLPSGLLFEMARYSAERVGERIGSDDRRRGSGHLRNEASLRQYAAAANDAFVRAGVTAVVDAGPANDLSTLQMWADLRRAGVFLPAVTAMRSTQAQVPAAAIAELSGWAESGPAKVMLTMSGGALVPDEDSLDRIVAGCLAEGSGVAVHAVEADAVLAACRAFERAGRLILPVGEASTNRAGQLSQRLRIEHAAETPPEVCLAIKRCGASVTTQPGFVFDRGDRYLSAARAGGPSPDDLYAVRGLLELGIPVRGSSDAPYGPVPPLDAIYGGVMRTSRSGHAVGQSQRINAMQALELYFGATPPGKDGAVWEALRPGARADLVLLGDDPQTVAAERIRGIEVIATIIAGQIVWRA